MNESAWEKSIGTTVTRTQATGQDGLFLQRYEREHGHMAGPPNVKWSVIARLGQQTIDLKHRSDDTKDADDGADDDGEYSSDGSDIEDPGFERGDDDEWDTTEWSPEDIKTAAATLVEEMNKHGCSALRREKAVGLLQRLAQRNPPAVRYLESVIEEYAINGLRLPLYGEPEPSEQALYLVGSLANELPDKYSRIGVIFKAVAFLNFERDLAASLLQHTWARHRFYTKDVVTLDNRSIARRQVMLNLKSYNLARRWVEMRRRANGARLPFATLRDVLQLLDGMLQDGSSDFVKKNRWKLVQSGGLPTIVRLATHVAFEVRSAAVNIMLSLAKEVDLRSSMLVVGAQDALLDLLHGEGGDEEADDDDGDGGDNEEADGTDIDETEDADGPATSDKTADSAVPQVTGPQSPGGATAGAGAGAGAGSSAVAGALTLSAPGLEDRLAALEVLDLLAEGGMPEDPSKRFAPVDFHAVDENTVEGRRALIQRLAREAKEADAKRGSDDEDDAAPVTVALDDTAARELAELEAKRAASAASGTPATPQKPPRDGVARSPTRETRLTFYHERACRRRMRLAIGFDVIHPFSEETLAAIASSEAPINVDGDGYFSTLANPDVINRLVQLLLAGDDATVLGATMVLTKLARTNLHRGVVDTIMNTSKTLQSIVDLLHTPAECLSTAALLLLREMVSQEESRIAVLQQGVAAMLLVVCKQTPHDSMPFTLALLGVLAFARPDAIGPESDPEPIDLNSTPIELSDALARTLLSLMTAAPRQVAVCVLAIVKLGALSQVIRFLCGGFDFLGDGDEEDDDDEDDEGGGVPGTDWDDEGGGVPGTDWDADSKGSGDAGSESGGKSGDEGGGSDADEGDDEDDDDAKDEDEEKWARSRERRCIAALVLERVCQCDLAVEQLCDARVLSFLVFVLRGNRADDAAENVLGVEASPAERRVMHVSNQAVCRTLNALARSKVLTTAQRHRVARAVLGLGAVSDIADLIVRSDPAVEPDDPVSDDTVEAALVLLATIMPKGEGDGDIENGQIVRTIPEYVESFKKKRNIESQVRRASITELNMKHRLADAERSGDAEEAETAIRMARRSSLAAAAVQQEGKAQIQDIEQENNTSSGPGDPTAMDSTEVAEAVAVAAKPLLDLLVRTRSPSMRTTTLFTLARCCHSAATSDIIHEAGAMNIVVGFFPPTPLLRRYFPDRVNMALSEAEGSSMRAMAGASGLARPPSPIAVGRPDVASKVLSDIPLTAFTFLAELSRTHSIKSHLCLSGIFSSCVERFALQTANPAQDRRVQGELALFLARCACLNVEDWGSTNDKILRDSKFVTHKHDLEDKAVGGGAVVLGLVRLVAERTHRRAKYHAALCLARLADDVMRTVPPMVYAGVVPAMVAVLKNAQSPHSLVRQCLRVLQAVANFPMRRFANEMVAAGAVPILTGMGSDLTLQMALPRIDGETVADTARVIATALGEEAVDAARRMAPSPVVPPPGTAASAVRQWPPSPVSAGAAGASPWATPTPHAGPRSPGMPSSAASYGRYTASPYGAGAGAGAGASGSPALASRGGGQAGVDPSPPRILKSSSSLSRVRMEASLAASRAHSAPPDRDRVAGHHVGDQGARADSAYATQRQLLHSTGGSRRSGRSRRSSRGAAPTSSILKHLSKRGYTPAGVPQRTTASAVPVNSTAIQASYNYLFDPLFDSGPSDVRHQTWQQDHRAATGSKSRQLC